MGCLTESFAWSVKVNLAWWIHFEPACRTDTQLDRSDAISTTWKRMLGDGRVDCFFSQRFRVDGVEGDELRGCARRVRAAIMEAGSDSDGVAGRGNAREGRRVPGVGDGEPAGGFVDVGGDTDREESAGAGDGRVGSGRDSDGRIERAARFGDAERESDEEDEVNGVVGDGDCGW